MGVIEAARLQSRATSRTYNLRAKGLIPKVGLCQFCGEIGPLQAHHSRYEIEHLSSVALLCSRCHTAADRARRSREADEYHTGGLFRLG